MFLLGFKKIVFLQLRDILFVLILFFSFYYPVLYAFDKPDCQNKILSSQNKYQPYFELGGAKYFNQTSSVADIYDLFVPLLQGDGQLLFVDLRIFDRSGSSSEGNLHFGYRKLYPNTKQMFAIYAAFDRKRSNERNDFNQLTLGFEYWYDRLFMGGNIYKPIGQTKVYIAGEKTEIQEGRSLVIRKDCEKALPGGDAELGYSITESLTSYVGGYYFTASGVDAVIGTKVRVTYDYMKPMGHILGVLDGVSIEAGAQHDRERKNTAYIGIKFKVGLTSFEKNSNVSGFERHMVELVRRDPDVVTVKASEFSPKFEKFYQEGEYGFQEKDKSEKSEDFSKWTTEELLNELGLSGEATYKEVKKRFYELALKYHPDKGGREKDFIKINIIYETLRQQLNYTKGDANQSKEPSVLPHVSLALPEIRAPQSESYNYHERNEQRGRNMEQFAVDGFLGDDLRDIGINEKNQAIVHTSLSTQTRMIEVVNTFYKRETSLKKEVSPVVAPVPLQKHQTASNLVLYRKNSLTWGTKEWNQLKNNLYPLEEEKFKIRGITTIATEIEPLQKFYLKQAEIRKGYFDSRVSLAEKGSGSYLFGWTNWIVGKVWNSAEWIYEQPKMVTDVIVTAIAGILSLKYLFVNNRWVGRIGPYDVGDGQSFGRWNGGDFPPHDDISFFNSRRSQGAANCQWVLSRLPFLFSVTSAQMLFPVFVPRNDQNEELIKLAVQSTSIETPNFPKFYFPSEKTEKAVLDSSWRLQGLCGDINYVPDRYLIGWQEGRGIGLTYGFGGIFQDTFYNHFINRDNTIIVGMVLLQGDSKEKKEKETRMVLRRDDIELLRTYDSVENIEEIPHNVNMHYEYEDTDINTLLLLRSQEAGLDLARTVLMPPLGNDQIVEQLYEERVRYREQVLAQEIEPVARTILVPVNINNVHWVGLIIRLDKRNQVLQIQYVDPLGNSMIEDSIPEEIRRSLKIVYGRRIYIENLMLLRQTDGTACGALTVENLVRAAQGQLDTVIAYGDLTRLIRSHHVGLLERFSSNSWSSFRQENSMSKWSIRKTMKISFITQFDDMIFHRFLPGRMIFLYGTSTAGKSSIVKHIKIKALLEGIDLVITGTDIVSDLHNFHAYFTYSPGEVGFLRRYFTIEEILHCIYSPDLIYKLIKEKLITKKKEVLIIQRILDKLRINKEEIRKRFFSFLKRPYFCLQSFLSALSLGKTVIVDTVGLNDFSQTMITHLLHCRMSVVMVYCSPKKLMERLYCRNAAALISLTNSRPGAFPIVQYTRMYKPIDFSYQSIDSIDFSDIQIPIELPMICKLIFERDGRLHQYRENQWIEAKDQMQRIFGIYTNSDRTFIKPWCSYHFFVNTGKENAETCGEKILKTLRILEK